MDDGNTPTLPCRECGTAIAVKPRGRKPTRCADCRLAARRASIRDYCRRKRAGVKPATTYTCADCGCEQPRPARQGPTPERCLDCWTRRERQRGDRRRHEKFEPLRVRFRQVGRWNACVSCGAPVRCARQKGPGRRWCATCGSARRRELDRATRPRSRQYVCAACGREGLSTNRGNARQYCPDCAMLRRRNHQAARRVRKLQSDHAPIEAFTRLEIFKRDRWRCGICKRRINPSLRHPHPMSASLDHVIPVSQGGPHARANCRASHLRCNVRRNNRGGNEQLALFG